MTIKNVINGFIKKFKEVFNMTIYDDEITHGLTTPSFHIQLSKMEFKKLVGRQRKYELYISATYFPKDKDNKQDEYNDIIQKITENFELVEVDKRKVHVVLISQNENKRDDALVLLFKMEIHAMKKEVEYEKMKEIEVVVKDGN